ncbi:hypothetical protein P5673_007452 [Acropora cervicornis]|uniref:Death domain-containing protein n=1 Tax=Acropora cervicornis TaxID=6130 RepID=A0AAD9QWI2_ACRCE|nr:hypothetical protein P5673_007452 [Acropora cervicornis]
MATVDTVEIERVPTPLRCLKMNVLEELSRKLNPRHNTKDFRYLAGLMNYTYEMVKNLEREKNPTAYLVSEWAMCHASGGEPKTVGDLLELLKEMRRDDAVEILKPFEFTGPHSYQDYLNYVGSPLRSQIPPYHFQNGSRPYQEVLANIQHTVFHNFGSPLASEPRPPVRSSNLQHVVSDKVALVIGNQKYVNKRLQGLVYSEKDAYDMAHVLSELEFKARVVSLVNLTLAEMRIAVLMFCRLLENGVKRGRLGNNIFAYSCSSQHEAYEEPGQTNGLYALHLLRHIKRDERIEFILMDVARDVSMASNRNLIQRPCHESDAVFDCRLCDKIAPSNLSGEFMETMKLWMQAHHLPKKTLPIRQDGIVVSFEYITPFSNVLEVRILATNETPFARHEVVMDFSVPTPVKAELAHISGDFLAENGGSLQQRVLLSRLQKQEDPIEVTFKMMYTIDEEVIDWEVPVQLGCPLVSSVFEKWDWWITCGRLPAQKSTQV